MNVVQCPNRHFYDSDVYPECPHCQSAGASTPQSEKALGYPKAAIVPPKPRRSTKTIKPQESPEDRDSTLPELPKTIDPNESAQLSITIAPDDAAGLPETIAPDDPAGLPETIAPDDPDATEPERRICENCKKEIPFKMQFCRYCGAPTGAQEPYNSLNCPVYAGPPLTD